VFEDLRYIAFTNVALMLTIERRKVWKEIARGH